MTIVFALPLLIETMLSRAASRPRHGARTHARPRLPNLGSIEPPGRRADTVSFVEPLYVPAYVPVTTTHWSSLSLPPAAPTTLSTAGTASAAQHWIW